MDNKSLVEATAWYLNPPPFQVIVPFTFQSHCSLYLSGLLFPSPFWAIGLGCVGHLDLGVGVRLEWLSPHTHSLLEANAWYLTPPPCVPTLHYILTRSSPAGPPPRCTCQCHKPFSSHHACTLAF